MDRRAAFDNFKDHPWLSKAFAKLRAEEIKISRDFINSNNSMNKGEFELAINRMFLGKEKPKNWTIICELLTCANSAQN